MLESFISFVSLLTYILYTYNGDRFDFPFILERGKIHVNVDMGFGNPQLVGKGTETAARIMERSTWTCTNLRDCSRDSNSSNRFDFTKA